MVRDEREMGPGQEKQRRLGWRASGGKGLLVRAGDIRGGGAR
jgi:hypothetical protein